MLQHALWKTNHHRICVSPLNTVILADWLQVAITVHDHPVGIHMLVPACPTYIGAMDASKQGMGGFWLATNSDKCMHLSPSLWYATFPDTIKY
jgi:hypothetical protein